MLNCLGTPLFPPPHVTIFCYIGNENCRSSCNLANQTKEDK